MLRFSAHLIIGTVLLGLIYFGLGNIPFRAMALAYIAHIVTGGLNLVWLAAIVVMVVFGVRTQRPGYAVAPLLVIAIWFSLSVYDRAKVQSATDPALANRAIPLDLRASRTLIIEQQGEGCCGQFKLLTDGAIDRYVYVETDDRTGGRKSITAHRLARMDECREVDKENSVLLARAGRTDECFIRSTLTDVPDGVLLRMKWMAYAFALGCCNQGQVFERTGGKETLRTTWYFGRQLVRSYLPMLGFADFTPPAGLWHAGGASAYQSIQIGGPRFELKDIAAAVYGID